jgi:hypothetical protein
METMAEAVGPGSVTEVPERARWSGHCFFAVLVLAYLLPVWLFRHVPTQDGPAHLANAVILRDYSTPGTHHHEFYELAIEPFPNWTAHLMLAGFSWLVHPLVAEKLLVTFYVVGFAYAARFFLISWHPDGVMLAPLCLLFIFHRCFFMGFYSYCLGLPLCFLIYGLCARLPERLSPGWLVGFAGLLLLAYFTHLVAYVQAVVGAIVLVLCRPGRRGPRLLTLGVALLPSLAFCADYLASTGLTPAVLADMVARNWGTRQPGGQGLSALTEDLTHLHRDLFITYQAWSIPIGICFWLMFGAYAAAGVSRVGHSPPESTSLSKSWLPVFTVGVVMTLLYLAAPEALGVHGGYLKPRLAIVLPVLWLALLRPPSRRWQKVPLMVGSYALVLTLLVCTCFHFAAANRILDQYLAGLRAIGRGQVIYVIQSTEVDPYEVSYLLHASSYYCLDTGCTNLDNYEATARYCPVRFRPGVSRGRGGRLDLAYYPRVAAVSRVLAWEWPARPTALPPDGFHTIFRDRSLTIYGR